MCVRTTNKEIKKAWAIDCTNWSHDDIKKLLPVKEELSYSAGSYGCNR